MNTDYSERPICRVVVCDWRSKSIGNALLNMPIARALALLFSEQHLTCWAVVCGEFSWSGWNEWLYTSTAPLWHHNFLISILMLKHITR